MDWRHILAYVTGTVDQELLARNEYLAAENRILMAQLKGRPRLSDAERLRWARSVIDPHAGYHDRFGYRQDGVSSAWSIDGAGKIVVMKQLRRGQLFGFFEKLQLRIAKSSVLA